MYAIAQQRGYHPETFWLRPPTFEGAEREVKAKGYEACAEDYPDVAAAKRALATCFTVEIRSAYKLAIGSLATLDRQERRRALKAACGVPVACAVDTSLAMPGAVTEVMREIREMEILERERERETDLVLEVA
jgi:hypothetical protein